MNTPCTASSVAFEDGPEDNFEPERRVLFEEIFVSTSPGAKKMTRFEAFLEAERKRALNSNISAMRNVEELEKIIRRHADQEDEIEQNPTSFAARKHKQEQMLAFAAPFAAFISYYQSQNIAKNYIANEGGGDPAPIIKPYYIDDRYWKGARARVNKINRNARGPGLYEIGNKKPPTKSRFKKGEGGNPKGRPKAGSLYKRLQGSLDAPIEVADKDGVRKQMSRREVMLRNVFTSAMQEKSKLRKELMRRIKYLEKRKMLKPLPTKQRRRPTRLNDEQKRRFCELTALCFAHAESEMKNLYDRRYGKIPPIVDHEYEALQNAPKHKAPAGNKNLEGKHQNENDQYPSVPTIRRARSPVVKRLDAPSKNSAAGAKRSSHKPSK